MSDLKDLKLSENSLPVHLGIIMDGNRRWAKKNFLPSLKGHQQGVKTFRKICTLCNEIGIRHLTVYAFSTENWKRSEEEVSYLMRIFKKYLQDIIDDKIESENIKIKFIGAISKLPENLRTMISETEKKSEKNTGLNLNIALNYGGREEITNASKILAEEAKLGKINIEDITEQYFSEKLYTKSQPDLDLIIRTAGEKRTSNFMIWQAAYAEFYSTSTLWPDFDENELKKALEEYGRRVRRFGGA